MTYAAHSTGFHPYAARDSRAAAPAAAPRRGFLSRFFAAMRTSREREADRVAGAYLARTGHRFTDSIERELNDRLFNSGWNARR